MIARIKSIDQAQVLTDDILSKRELLDFFEGRVNGVKAWKKADDLVKAGDDAFAQLKKDTDFLEKFDNVINDADLNKHIFDGQPKYDNGLLRDFSGFHSNKKLVDPTQTSFNQGDIKIQNIDTDYENGYVKSKYRTKVEYDEISSKS